MPIRRRCFRPMCIPFHEVNLSVTIEFLSRERDSNPQMFPSTRFCRPAPYHSDISTYFYLTKCQRTMLWERRDSNPQSQKRAMLQTARLPITGYSPNFKEVDLRGTDCQNLYLGNPLLGTCAVLPVCCVPPYSFSRNQLLFTD